MELKGIIKDSEVIKRIDAKLNELKSRTGGLGYSICVYQDRFHDLYKVCLDFTFYHASKLPFGERTDTIKYEHTIYPNTTYPTIEKEFIEFIDRIIADIENKPKETSFVNQLIKNRKNYKPGRLRCKQTLITCFG